MIWIKLWATCFVILCLFRITEPTWYGQRKDWVWALQKLFTLISVGGLVLLILYFVWTL